MDWFDVVTWCWAVILVSGMLLLLGTTMGFGLRIGWIGASVMLGW